MFTALQATRLAHCSRSQLTHWRRNGLVVPSGDAPFPYTFQDVVALRLVVDWLRSGLTSRQVRRAVEYIRSTGEDLSSLRLVSDGATVWACVEDGQVLDALRAGQLALFVDVEGIADAVRADVRTFEAERTAFLSGLFDTQVNGIDLEVLDLVAAEDAEVAEGALDVDGVTLHLGSQVSA